MRSDRKKEITDNVREDWRVSVRRACKVLRFDRSIYQYKSRRGDAPSLRARIKEICKARVVAYRQGQQVFGPENIPDSLMFLHAGRIALQDKAALTRLSESA